MVLNISRCIFNSYLVELVLVFATVSLFLSLFRFDFALLIFFLLSFRFIVVVGFIIILSFLQQMYLVRSRFFPSFRCCYSSSYSILYINLICCCFYIRLNHSFDSLLLFWGTRNTQPHAQIPNWRSHSWKEFNSKNWVHNCLEVKNAERRPGHSIQIYIPFTFY